MKTLKHAALAALTAGVMCTAAASTGYAASSIDARLQALENELRALRAEVAERDAKIAAMEEKTAKIDAIAAKTDDMPKFKPNKLEMESADGQFSMGIAGRIQADAYAIDDDNSALNAMGNGAQLRRARLGAYGKMFGAWQYKFEVEYAGDKVAIKDAYVQTGLTDELKIRAGHFKEFYGIDHLTSDNYVTFMERASSSVYWPDEAMGVGLIYGDEKLYGIQAGIYSPGVASGGAGGTTDWSVTGRGYVAPQIGSGVVHVGLNGSYRGYETSATTKFEQRPETHLAEKVLRTGNIANPSSETRFGPEIAAVFGPVSAQAQYDWSQIDRDGGLPSVSTEGGYVEASWFVTGESRNYDVKSGTFGRPKATNAIQLAARYSRLKLEDAALTDARRGTMDNITLGANYFFNPNVRLMLNWVRADTDYTVSTDETYNIVQSRLQLDW